MKRALALFLFIGCEKPPAVVAPSPSPSSIVRVEAAHSASEIDERQREIDDEIARLPSQLRERVRPHARRLAIVSTVEGRFGEPATRPWDRAASLGIFQWAAPRNTRETAGSSLARLFVDLKRRAGEAPLYAAAWREVSKAGLSVRSGGALFLDGKAATGGEIEARFAVKIGKGALRGYQLIAAVDWIDRILGAELPVGGTVGSLLTSETGRTTAVLLGVNRPRYVVEALSAARARGGDLETQFIDAAVAIYPAAQQKSRRLRLMTAYAP